MANLITVASGKGGVGKSVVVSNLGWLLAGLGHETVIADLDTGAADLAVMFGEFKVQRSLNEFMQREVSSLEDALTPISGVPRLKLLAGSGETLATANPTYATKQRIIRHLRRLPAEWVIVDIGAGAGFNQLDYFLCGDLKVVVTTPDPTALMDAYRFVKLAAIRKIVMTLSGKPRLKGLVASQDFASIAEIRDALAGESREPELPAMVDTLAAEFEPKLILNRASGAGRVNYAQVRELLRKYTGAELEVLGEVVQDPSVEKSVREYLPVCRGYPGSPAARQLTAIASTVAAALRSSSSSDDSASVSQWEELLPDAPPATS